MMEISHMSGKPEWKRIVRCLFFSTSFNFAGQAERFTRTCSSHDDGLLTLIPKP